MYIKFAPFRRIYIGTVRAATSSRALIGETKLSDIVAANYEITRLRKKLRTYEVCNDMDLLAPVAKKSFIRLEEHLKKSFERGVTSTLFRPFETYRSAIRQNELYKQVPQVTKAAAFWSPHQYGLAVDFVPFQEGSFNWHENNDYVFLKESAELFGLVRPLGWDKCHIEHPQFQKMKSLIRP